MTQLDGKVAIVTGATGGIGRAIASRFHDDGARLILSGRRSEWSGPDGSIYLAGDVADERYVAELVSAARDAFGGLDILVNSHGIDLHSELAATALEDVQRIIGSNFVGVFLTMKHAIPVLAARGGGAIVNISSRLGQVAIIGQAVYGATKAAVDQLSRGAAVDLASMRIRVNSVAPGLTETEMIGAWIAGNENPETFREALVSGVPLGRMARPEEIADAVAYLAGPESGYITGTTLTVDGGYTAQ